MNKKEVSKLELSEQVYFDDDNQEFKTYTINEKEYKLYGSLNPQRLDNESFEEYKVRRIFINQKQLNSKKGQLFWASKNEQNLKLYNLARSLNKVKKQPEDKIQGIRHNALASNLGTYNKKKLEELKAEMEKGFKDQVLFGEEKYKVTESEIKYES